jgi:hypothetical protein
MPNIFPVTKEDFVTERTKIISKMLDNPDKHGIYPTTVCFAEFDDLFDKITMRGSLLEDLSEAQKLRNQIKK